MLTPKQFLIKLKEKRDIDLSYPALLKNLQRGKIKSIPHNVGARKGYLIPESEIEDLEFKSILA